MTNTLSTSLHGRPFNQNGGKQASALRGTANAALIFKAHLRLVRTYRHRIWRRDGDPYAAGTIKSLLRYCGSSSWPGRSQTLPSIRTASSAWTRRASTRWAPSGAHGGLTKRGAHTATYRLHRANEKYGLKVGVASHDFISDGAYMRIREDAPRNTRCALVAA